MNIAWFSEVGQNQKYPRTFDNARTEIAWCIALDAPMCSLKQPPIVDKKFDLGIVLIPKSDPKIDLNSLRNTCDKIAIAQEGPHWYYQDYDIDKQFHYLNTLLGADIIYAANAKDVKYYKGLGCKDVRVIRSLMIPDGLVPRSETLVDNYGDLPSPKSYENPKTMIGGNFVSWYSGIDSYIVAKQMGDPITAPSMGRKQPMEDQIEDIQYLPYLTWRNWIDELGKHSVGIHLMRTHAAGTFAMNCAFHGIPCLGYDGLDTQRILHPNTTIEVGDMERAMRLAKKLKDDLDFYESCSREASYRFGEYYTEKKWKENWNKQW